MPVEEATRVPSVRQTQMTCEMVETEYPRGLWLSCSAIPHPAVGLLHVPIDKTVKTDL